MLPKLKVYYECQSNFNFRQQSDISMFFFFFHETHPKRAITKIILQLHYSFYVLLSVAGILFYYSPKLNFPTFWDS